jgi:hypothetical protein
MATYELAQLNIGVIKAPMDSPVMEGFASQLDDINALAEATPGFVWRLQTNEGDATAIRPFDDPNMLVNMSVWRDVESLNNYVYSSAHVELMRSRREWFERMTEAYLVLWWVPQGHRPSITEALERLNLLRSQGPTESAFTFRQPFRSPGSGQSSPSVGFASECPAS